MPADELVEAVRRAERRPGGAAPLWWYQDAFRRRVDAQRRTCLRPAACGCRGAPAPQAVSEVTVWSEVVPPFTLMPREALEAAGNAVMAGVMRTLLPLFLRRRALVRLQIMRVGGRQVYICVGEVSGGALGTLEHGRSPSAGMRLDQLRQGS